LRLREYRDIVNELKVDVLTQAELNNNSLIYERLIESLKKMTKTLEELQISYSTNGESLTLNLMNIEKVKIEKQIELIKEQYDFIQRCIKPYLNK
jgi:hypothetical protein